MRIIHIVHGKANPDGHNGISRVVYHLNKQEKLLGLDSQIWAVVDNINTHTTHIRDAHVTIECFPRVWVPFLKNEIIDQIVAQKETIDIVHFHMIWFYDKNIIARTLKKAGIPFIITTHGTYSKPHAFTGKRRLARSLFELSYLKLAAEVHLLTREEGTGLQKYGFDGPSFVAPNGIDLGEISQERRRNAYENKAYHDKVRAIWVGVLREDKNLSGLINAVAMLPTQIRGQLTVALVGPDYRGNRAKYETLASKMGVRENFDFVGPLYGQEKFDAIESADFLVMPSFSEGMSLAVLDVLACGKPSVLTTGCGMNYYAKYDFFIPCEPFAQDIARGICELFERRSDWQKMGRNALDLVEEELNWKSIASVMLENYRRIVLK